MLTLLYVFSAEIQLGNTQEHSKMKFMLNNIVLIFVSSGICIAEPKTLTDEQLGDFIAEEGVCNIKVADGCNTSDELKLVLETKKLQISPSIVTTNNANHMHENTGIGNDIFAVTEKPGNGFTPQGANVPRMQMGNNYIQPNNNLPEISSPYNAFTWEETSQGQSTNLNSTRPDWGSTSGSGMINGDPYSTIRQENYYESHNER